MPSDEIVTDEVDILSLRSGLNMSRRNIGLRSVALQSTDIPFRGNNNPKSHYGSCKPLMTGPEGNSQFCFPRISMFPEAKPRKTSRFVICYIAGNFEAGNSLNLAVTEVVGQHSRVTVHCYPLTSYILQCEKKIRRLCISHGCLRQLT